MAKNSGTKTDSTPKVLPAASPAVDDYYKMVQAYGANADPSSSVPSLNSNILSSWGGASTLGVGGTPNYSVYYGGAPATAKPTASGTPPAGAAANPAYAYGGAPTQMATGATANPNSLAARLGTTPSNYAGNPTSDDLTDPTKKQTAGDWLAHGGLSVGGQLGNMTVGAVTKKLGISSPADVIGQTLGIQSKRADATDKWGTASKNAGTAGDYDYAAYVNSTGLKDAYAKYTADTSPQGQKNLNFIKASYDVNGDGQVSPGEFGQWWAEQTDDGKKAMANGDFMTPAQSFKAAQGAGAPGGATTQMAGDTMTPEQLADGSGGAPSGPTGASTAPALSSNDLNQQALAAIQKAMATKLTPRLNSDFNANKDAYLQPFNDQISAYDAAAQERLGTQIAQNQSRATLANAYGGSRHGVADAELERTSLLDQNVNDANLRAAALQQAQSLYGADSSSMYNSDVANLQNIYTGAQDLSTLGVTADSNSRNNIMTQAQMGQLQQQWDLAMRNGDYATLQKIQALLASTPTGSTSTVSGPQPNAGTSALGGAATGASVGSAFGPWGALAGGVVGGVGGYVSAR